MQHDKEVFDKRDDFIVCILYKYMFGDVQTLTHNFDKFQCFTRKEVFSCQIYHGIA